MIKLSKIYLHTFISKHPSGFNYNIKDYSLNNMTNPIPLEKYPYYNFLYSTKNINFKNIGKIIDYDKSDTKQLFSFNSDNLMISEYDK